MNESAEALYESMNGPALPAGMGERGGTFWRWYFSQYAADEPFLTLCEQVATCIDRIHEAQDEIAARGPYFTNRFGELRPNPALKVEAANKVILQKLLRDLLPDEEEERRAPGRPPDGWGRKRY